MNIRDIDAVDHDSKLTNSPATAAGLLFICGVFNKTKCNQDERTELGIATPHSGISHLANENSKNVFTLSSKASIV